MGEHIESGEFFGLDIGSTAVRLVQLKKRMANPALVTYNEVQFDHMMTTDSSADRELISAAVKQLVVQSNITTKNVVASLPIKSTFASIITTPKLSNAELANAVRYQADKYIPMPINEVKLDFLPSTTAPDATEMEVLLVAAPLTVINNYLGIIEGAGLEPVGLETDGVALTRALTFQAEAPVMILDVGAVTIGLVIVLNNTPRLIRSITGGSLVFARMASKALGINEEQAMQMLQKFGITQSKLEGQVYNAAKPALDTVTTEVQKSIKFFVERYPSSKLEKIVLVGSGSRLPELPNYLANATGLPIEIGNPWMNVSYPAGEDQAYSSATNQFAVALGLAQRGMR